MKRHIARQHEMPFTPQAFNLAGGTGAVNAVCPDCGRPMGPEALSCPACGKAARAGQEAKTRPLPYQPKTGECCHCRRGVERDNCPDCEGTGMRIDFRRIRAAVALEVGAL